MTYSFVALIAVAIHLIINVDVLRKGIDDHFPAAQAYRNFLCSVIVYHITDAFWGVLYEQHLVTLVFADTMAYFVAMAISMWLWTAFIVRYLDCDDRFRKGLVHAGRTIFALQIMAVVANLFTPILFHFDAGGAYHADVARNAMMVLQSFMLFLTVASTLTVAARTDGIKRRHHLAVGLGGATMMLFFAAQVFLPLLPMYSIGYLLGICMLHTFVVEDERAEYVRALEEALNRAATQQRELGATREMAYSDPLTHVKNKRAHKEAEERMDQRIASGSVAQFAVAVFDLNNLKVVNDTLGHEAGDNSIVSACKIICSSFKHSPVFRIGGDEFVAILEGEDYADRHELISVFNNRMDANTRHNEDVVVSSGFADFDMNRDHAYGEVFQRADNAMYLRKRMLKAMGGQRGSRDTGMYQGTLGAVATAT